MTSYEHQAYFDVILLIITSESSSYEPCLLYLAQFFLFSTEMKKVITFKLCILSSLSQLGDQFFKSK